MEPPGFKEFLFSPITLNPHDLFIGSLNFGLSE